MARRCTMSDTKESLWESTTVQNLILFQPVDSFLLKAGMLGKPSVEPLQCALSEREGRIRRVLNLRHGCASDPGKHAQLGTIELPVREFRCQEKQRCDGGCRGKRAAPYGFDPGCGGLFDHVLVPFFW